MSTNELAGIQPSTINNPPAGRRELTSLRAPRQTCLVVQISSACRSKRRYCFELARSCKWLAARYQGTNPDGIHHGFTGCLKKFLVLVLLIEVLDGHILFQSTHSRCLATGIEQGELMPPTRSIEMIIGLQSETACKIVLTCQLIEMIMRSCYL